MPPMWLHEHAIDLFESDGFGAVAYGFQQRTDAEVAGSPENTFTIAAYVTTSSISAATPL